MKQGSFLLEETRPLRDGVRWLRFSGDASAIRRPGEFVQLQLPGKFLRRPFSVSDWEDGWFSLIVEEAGDGTRLLQELEVGTRLDVLTGLGHGFELDALLSEPDALSPDTYAGRALRRILLFGSGTGLSPLVGLARRLLPYTEARTDGAPPAISLQAVLGFREPEKAFGREFFPGLDVIVTGDPFSLLPALGCDGFFACGSQGTMRRLCETLPSDGQIAFDLRLGCGFGACMGCSIRTADGLKRFCQDGPVFRKGELLWED